MKNLSRIVSAFMIVCMFVTCIFVNDSTTAHVYADNVEANIESSVAPENNEEPSIATPETVKAPEINSVVADVNKISVGFTSVEGAEYYIVNYSVNGEEKNIETAKTTLDITNLKEKTTYIIKVCAVFFEDDTETKSEWSEKSVTTKEIVLNAPSVAIEPYNLGAILTWKVVPNATSYEVWRYVYGKWSKIKVVSGTTYTDKGLKAKKGYIYKVRAVRTTNGSTKVGAYSSNKSIVAKKCLTGDIRMGYNTGVLIKNAKKYKAGSSTKLMSKTKLKRGTKFTILQKKRYGKTTMLNIKLSNGQKYWIRQGTIRYNAPYTSLDYTTQAKERFVNKKGYSSSSKYLIFICHYTQRVYLFTGSKGKWVHKATYRCATGKATTRSPQGIFKITKKGKRTALGSKYATYFYKTNAFHARPAGSKTMGKPASNGCIRMYQKDAIYFYKSMPKGTTIVSY